MNPWLLPLIFLAAVAVGGLAYDLVHRGRRFTRDLGSLAGGMKRVHSDMEALADRCDPPTEPARMPTKTEQRVERYLGELQDEKTVPASGPAIMPPIMPTSVELAAAVVGLIPESEAPRPGSVRSRSTATVGQVGPRSVSGSNGHRSKNRGRKRHR